MFLALPEDSEVVFCGIPGQSIGSKEDIQRFVKTTVWNAKNVVASAGLKIGSSVSLQKAFKKAIMDLASLFEKSYSKIKYPNLSQEDDAQSLMPKGVLLLPTSLRDNGVN